MQNLFTHYTDSSAVFPSFPIVQHNYLGSWDVFLSLFHSITMLLHPPLIVATQGPLSRRSVLPTFPGFPGRSTADAILVLQHNVESVHRLRYKVSTLFLDVKGGFDNVESPSLLSLLRRKGVSPYMV